MHFAFSIFALVLATASCIEAEFCGASEGELALLQLRRANATKRSDSGAVGGGAFPGFDFGGGGGDLS